jgi:hypothetical protein
MARLDQMERASARKGVASERRLGGRHRGGASGGSAETPPMETGWTGLVARLLQPSGE